MGYVHGVEYAALLNANNGETIPVKDVKMLRGEKSEVDVSGWMDFLAISKELSLIALHSHTNDTLFSLGDIKWFIENAAIATMIVVSGNKAYSLTKVTANHGSYDMFFKRIFDILNEEHILTIEDKSVVIAIYTRAFEQFGIRIEEW